MARHLFRYAAPLLPLAVLLASCGGGGGSSSATATLYTGQFVDGPVKNLAYLASPSRLAGTTDAKGTFNFRAGDTVTFTAAGLLVGTATPSVSSNGAVVVTPMTLTGESNPSNAANVPQALAIARALDSLNTVSAGLGAGVSGALVVPTATIDPSHFATLYSTMNGLGSAGTVSSTSLQSALNTVYGNSVYTVSADATALTALQAAAANASFVGSFWSASLTPANSNSAVSYRLLMRPDLTVAGTTSAGDTLSGTWSLNSSDGSHAFTASCATTSCSVSGTIAASATSFTLSDGAQNSGTATLVTANTTGQSNAFTGLWTVQLTPTSNGATYGARSATTWTVLTDPNGQAGIVTSSGAYLTGTMDLNGGTMNVTMQSPYNDSVGLNFATRNGSDLVGGIAYYNFQFSR